MADERKTFKWGDNEYLVDDFLALHMNQEPYYYKYVRDKARYDQAAVAALRQAIANKLQLLRDSGQFESDGRHESDKVQNVTSTYKNKTFQTDITRAMNHYFSRLVSTLKPHVKEVQPSLSWDESKHGLGAYITSEGHTPQSVFDDYDVREQGSTSKKATAERVQLAKQLVNSYYPWVSSQNFDFSKNETVWDDDYLDDLLAFQTALNNTDNPISMQALEAGLRRFAGNDYARAFTDTGFKLGETYIDPTQTTEAIAKREQEEKQRKATQDAEIKNAWMRKWADSMRTANVASRSRTYQPIEGDPNSDTFYLWYKGLNEENKRRMGIYDYYLDIDNLDLWNQAYDRLMKEFKGELEFSNNPNDRFVLQRHWINNKGNVKHYIPLTNGWALMTQTVNSNGWGTVYNPVTGQTEIGSLYDMLYNDQQNVALKDLYTRYGYEWIKKQPGGVDYTTVYYPQYASGGFIPKYSFGRNVTSDWGNQSGKSSEATVTSDNKVIPNTDNKENPHRNRPASSAHQSDLYPDAGFSASDKARLAAAGVDIFSLFLEPITGIAAGVGSSFINFGADIGEDGLDWGDAKNLAINLGFDLLGAVPILGDMFGTGSKLMRTLVKLSPLVLTYFAGKQGIDNFDGMVGSWRKLANSKDEKVTMTVQDWLNISQSINLITGAGRAIKNKHAVEKRKAQAKVDDAVAIELIDAQGNKKPIIVNGELATKIKSRDGKKADIEADLATLAEFKDAFANGTLHVNTDTKFSLNPFYKDSNKPLKFGVKFIWDSGVKLGDVYDYSKVPQRGDGIHLGAVSRWLNRVANQIDNKIKGSGRYEDYTNALTVDEMGTYNTMYQPVKQKIDAIKTEMDAYNSQVRTVEGDVEKARRKAQSFSRKIRKATPEDIADVKNRIADIDKYPEVIKQLESEVKFKQDEVSQLNADLDGYRQRLTFESKPKKQASIKQQIEQIASKLKTAQQELKILNTKLNTVKSTASSSTTAQKRSDLSKFVDDYDNYQKQQKDLQNFKDQLQTLKSNKGTQSYKELISLLNDLRRTNPTIGNKKLDWSIESILSKENIPDAFKRGGSINKNKLNKFLNYAKG